MDDAGRQTPITPSQGIHVVLDRNSCRATARSSFRTRTTVPVRDSPAWQGRTLSRHDRHADRHSHARTAAAAGRARFPLQHAGRYLAIRPAARGCAEHVRRPRPLVAPKRSRRRPAISREHPSKYVAVRAGDDRRRKMDDVPPHGGGRRGHAARSNAWTATARIRARVTHCTAGAAGHRRAIRWPSMARTPTPIRGLAVSRPELSRGDSSSAALHLKAEVVWAAGRNGATVEDVLARRTRSDSSTQTPASRPPPSSPICWRTSSDATPPGRQ